MEDNRKQLKSAGLTMGREGLWRLAGYDGFLGDEPYDERYGESGYPPPDHMSSGLPGEKRSDPGPGQSDTLAYTPAKGVVRGALRRYFHTGK